MILGMLNEPERNCRRNWRLSRTERNFSSDSNFRLVERMLWYYSAIKASVEKERKAIGFYKENRSDNFCPRRHIGSSVSDPTAQAAMRRIEPLRSVVIENGRESGSIIKRPEEWLAVIEETFEHFERTEPLIAEILRRRFAKNESQAVTCAALGVSRNKYYRCRDVGIQYAKECALQLNLIKVFRHRGK